MTGRILKIRFDNSTAQAFDLTDGMILGRSPRAHLSCPNDAALSREHLALKQSGDEWAVVDLGSRNGTRVNGSLVTGRYVLRPGDRILAGHLVLLYERSEVPESPEVTQAGGPAFDELATLTSVDSSAHAAPAPASEPLPAPKDKPEPVGQAWLQVLDAPFYGKTYDLTRDFTIGRDHGCDIVLQDASVSRQHARIVLQSSRSFLLYSLGKNGTMVNGLPIADPRELRDRNEIRIGRTRLRFVQAIDPNELTPQGKRRLREVDPVWKQIEEGVRVQSRTAFVAAVRDLLTGALREAVGYRVEAEIPYFRGIAGVHVSAPGLGIRQSQFPIMVAPYDPENRAICDEIRQILEIERVSEYLAVLIAVPAHEGIVDEAQELRRKLLQAGQDGADSGIESHSSLMPHDFIVLDQQHVFSVAALGTSKRFIEIILSQGVELATVSPYVTAGPVPQGMFFGREREIKVIQNSIQTGSYAIVGGRRIGKSSILQRVEALLNSKPDRCFARYRNCEECFEVSDFIEGLAGEFELPEAPSGPIGFRKLVLHIQQRNPGRKIVFLLDEIDQLLSADAAEANPGQLFKVFRSLSHAGLCVFVFSGSRYLYQHLRDPKSPFFNFCKYRILRPLDRESVADIITRPLEQLGIELPQKQELINAIVDLTSCHPNLTQFVCEGLLRATKLRRISLADFEAVSNDPDFFEHYLDTARGEATQIEELISLLMDPPAFDLAELKGALTRAGLSAFVDLTEALEMLCLGALLERRGDQYRFQLEHYPRIARRSMDVPARIEALGRALR